MKDPCSLVKTHSRFTRTAFMLVIGFPIGHLTFTRTIGHVAALCTRLDGIWILVLAVDIHAETCMVLEQPRSESQNVLVKVLGHLTSHLGERRVGALDTLFGITQWTQGHIGLGQAGDTA